MSRVERRTDQAAVIITRQRHFHGYGRCYPFGWLYEVNGDHATTHLGEARSIAKRLYPGAAIIEAWKVQP